MTEELVRYVGRLARATAIAIGIAVVLIGAEKAGAYSLSLRVSNPRFLSGPDMLAADGAGDMFVLKATRVRGGALSNAEAQVVELSSRGHQVRAFTTTFHSGGHTFYMGASGIAVTPSGGQVVVIGNASTDRGLGSTHPLLAKFNVATGKLISATTYDTRDGSLTGGVALAGDASAVYVASEAPGSSVSFYVDEYSLSPLQRVRRLRINGGFASALAVDGGQLAIAYGPSRNTEKYLFRYTTALKFIDFTDWAKSGVAYGYRGFLMGGDPRSRAIDKLGAVGPPPPERFGAGDFSGLPIIEATDGAGDAFAYDAAGPVINQNPSAGGVILRFKPLIDRVRFLAVPPKRVRTPHASFSFDAAADAGYECRLIRVGAKAPEFRTPCFPPHVFNGLVNGASYVFELKTVSSEGGVSPTIRYRFKVALPVPRAIITAHPKKTHAGTKATFTFRSTVKGSNFRCRLFRPGSPLAAFVPCTSPATYRHLTPGTYDFQVEAISHLGVAQRKPTSFPFNVT